MTTATEQQGALMTNVEDIARFILGGRAVFTIVSKATGKRLTFKVTQRVQKDEATREVVKRSPYFVSLLAGPSNTSDYQYIGSIFDDGEYGSFELTAKSTMRTDSVPVKAFDYVFRRAMRDDDSLLNQIEFWHEGRCCCCGKPLTVPDSIAMGIGPVCLSNL